MSDRTWTGETLINLFAPGRNLKVLVEGRRTRGEQAVRHAVVLAADGEEMTMSAPVPHLSPPLLGLALEITVLADRAAGAPRRLAYVASILDELPSFPTPRGTEPAVVVMFPRPQDIYPTNLRKARRYPVSPGDPVQVLLEGQRLNLLDISQKGLRFSGGEELAAYAPGDEMRLGLVIHDEPQKVHGRVAAKSRATRGLVISLELGILPLDAWTSLVEVLKELEQAAASREDQ